MTNKGKRKPSDRRAGKRRDRNQRVGTRIPELGKVAGQKYLKTDRDIYRKLVQYGDEEKAIEVAKRCYKKCLENGKKKPSEMLPVSMVYRLVGEIQRKIGLF